MKSERGWGQTGERLLGHGEDFDFYSEGAGSQGRENLGRGGT